MGGYADLKCHCEDRGWPCRVYPVEVTCLGFVGRSVSRFLGDIRVAPRARRSTVRRLQQTAESASTLI